MFNKEEIKEFVIKFGKKILFPDASNRVTRYIMIAGVGVILGVNPYSIVFINWLVDTFNANNSSGFKIPQFSSDRVDYIWGGVLVLFSIVHNIIYQWIKFSQDRYMAQQQHEITMAEKRRQGEVFLKEKEMELAKIKKDIDVDTKLFKQFLSLLPSDSLSVYFLKEHNFHSSFHEKSTDAIDTFSNTWNTAEKKFLDDELETKKIDIWRKLRNLSHELENSVFPMAGMPMLRVYASGHYDSFDMPKEIEEKITYLNNEARHCYKLHQDFISLCRKKLGC